MCKIALGVGSIKNTLDLKLFNISISKDISSPTPADKIVKLFDRCFSEIYQPP